MARVSVDEELLINLLDFKLSHLRLEKSTIYLTEIMYW